jgi:hypothetical protein
MLKGIAIRAKPFTQAAKITELAEAKTLRN